MKETLQRQWDNLGALIHAIHGSRGIFLGALGLLILTVADPAFPRDLDRSILTVPIFAVFVIGLGTLPREGVAAQQRALHVLDEPDAPRRMARRLLWPGLLLVLLAPNIFLAMYGIPHLSWFTGLLTPPMQQRVTLGFLFLVLLVPALYLRSSRRYAPDIDAMRPRDLARHDQRHRERDILIWMSLVLFAAWAWLLHGFWTPFTLFDWPPGIGSFQAGPRGVGSLVFAVAIPLTLWMSLVAHLALLREIIRRKAVEAMAATFALGVVHVLVVLGCVVLHIYDVLWIVQYSSAAGF